MNYSSLRKRLPTFRSYLLASCVSFCLLFSSHLASSQLDAYKIKAVYIFRIASFVHWEQESSMTNIEFCTIGNSKVITTLQQLIKGKKVRGMGLEIHPYSRNNKRQCNVIIYVDDNNNKQKRAMTSPRHAVPAKGRFGELPPSILTISDTHGFANSTGMIELRVINENIKPVINTDNIQSEHFSISSKLLRISLLIEGAQ